VRRREFITLLGGAAAAWPLAARAQQPKVWHVGFLAPVPPTPAMLSALRDGLRERGYVEGQNLSIDVRWSEGSFEQNPGLAADKKAIRKAKNMLWMHGKARSMRDAHISGEFCIGKKASCITGAKQASNTKSPRNDRPARNPAHRAHRRSGRRQPHPDG
jgi:hypothetical protein